MVRAEEDDRSLQNENSVRKRIKRFSIFAVILILWHFSARTFLYLVYAGSWDATGTDGRLWDHFAQEWIQRPTSYFSLNGHPMSWTMSYVLGAPLLAAAAMFVILLYALAKYLWYGKATRLPFSKYF